VTEKKNELVCVWGDSSDENQKIMVKKLLPNKYCNRFLIASLWSIICITTITDMTQGLPTPPNGQLKTSVLKGNTSGNQISLNGRILPGVWLQNKTANSLTTYIGDSSIRQLFGVDLLNTSNPVKQPVRWFSLDTNQTLSSLLIGGYRYLDITDITKKEGMRVQANGNILVISTNIAKVTDIRQEINHRLTIDVDRATPWQINQVSTPIDPNVPSTPPNREWLLTLDGIAQPQLVKRYTPRKLSLLESLLKQLKPALRRPITPLKQVEVLNNQTFIRLSIPINFVPKVTTYPNRLVIDIQPDTLVERDITWTQGLRWQQRYVNLDAEKFPVTWLEINPRITQVKLKPILPNANTLVGTAPLILTAQQNSAVAAINGGYFNRNNRYPLGAIRYNNQWLSSPILNRGAIAWNNSGEFYFNRLTLEETLVTSTNRLPILFLNSGYVQAGIARYNRLWGATYIPLIDNEVILVVEKNQIVKQFAGGKANEAAIPIPENGYLLTLRGKATDSINQLPIGSVIQITSTTTPSDFSRYPNILGAGPLLLQNRQVVLDAKSEKFSDAFAQEKAVRSAICTTATGTLIIAAVHNRPNGAGPSLAEHTQLMRQMGCVNALNLDGGSSTSLYLGGELINRPASTAARVHNGIGIFLESR
jgi:hypothetical protein